MVERERVERRNQKERERKNRGESCCFSVFSPSPLLVRSSILRHSRRGLITAYHCCHGNSRSVKNLSALTLIVRLKFHGERVEFTLRTIDGTPVTRGYDGGIEYRLEEEIPRKVYTEGIRKTHIRIIDHDGLGCLASLETTCLSLCYERWKIRFNRSEGKRRGRGFPHSTQ